MEIRLVSSSTELLGFNSSLIFLCRQQRGEKWPFTSVVDPPGKRGSCGKNAPHS